MKFCMKNYVIFLSIVIVLASFSCHGVIAGDIMKYAEIGDVPQEKWQELSQKKIFFGHQSVGFNIIDGLKDVMKKYPEIHLNIVEGRNMTGISGVFLHSRIGQNTKPDSKIADFVEVIEKKLGAIPDAAILKFCFVDAHEGIDVKSLFYQYNVAMAKLRKEYPQLKIIHFTMPLRVQKTTWKTRVKLLAGREVWEFTDNIKRNTFNRLLLAEYKGKEPVFDIAGLEATTSDGTVTKFQYADKEYLSLNPAYSTDGGHLNTTGRRFIAEKLLVFLVNELL